MPGDIFERPESAGPAARARGPLVRGATLSVAAHAAALVIVALALGRSSSFVTPGLPQPADRLIYTVVPGHGGGDAGGGDSSATPVRPASVASREVEAMPAVPAASPNLDPATTPAPAERLPLVQPEVSSGLHDTIGSTTAVRALEAASRGPGEGPGADGRLGDGIGDGRGGRAGDRNGPGTDGVDGDRPGNGISWPRLLQELKPNYPADAMRARIEGVVHLEIVVLADGSVGRITLTRSLDARFGLDREAMEAVRRWRFEPARRLGTPVAVRVPVEVSFALR
jgi:periplasmic protein TonB